jgi:hypothetical protein
MSNVLHQFHDKDGTTYVLLAGVWGHIRRAHPEIQDARWIGDVLKEPDVIVRSNWSPTGRLYYRRHGKYYRTVVVDVMERRVKTAYITDRIKSGETVWSRA